MFSTSFQNEKNVHLGYKKKKLNSRKIDVFPKELTHRFVIKINRFKTSFFQAIQGRKMCFAIFQNEKTPFQAIKTGSSKSRKIAIFPKGLTHGFGQKMAIFPTPFFQAIQSKKMSFKIFQNEKTPYKAIKTRSSKKRIFAIFVNGVNPWFWPKNAYFSNFSFLGNICQENVFYDILN